jgi:hypothetical protein
MISTVDIYDAVEAEGTPLVLLTGFTGVGRTTTLARLCERFEAEDRHVSAMRFTADGNVVPARFVLPADGRAGCSATQLRGPVHGEPIWASIGPVAGAADEPSAALRAARATAAALQRTGDGTVLLLDDLHWIDRDSLAVLEALIRLLDGRPLTCVGTLRVPVCGAASRYGPDVLARLRKEDLVRTLRLPPLDTEQLTEEVAAALAAAPEPALVDRLHALSRGVQAAVGEATAALRRRGAIRVMDRVAYLVPGTVPAVPPPQRQSEYLTAVRELGPAVWNVAKAVAILFPLGAAMPRLVGDAVGVNEQETLGLLEVLRTAGVLHRGCGGTSWRFTVPLLATALAAACGPYERRTLAAVAVEAVWAGTATCPDPDHRTNLVADAGRLIDPVRASEDLIGRATTVREKDSESALHWFAAAAELADGRAQRAKVLLALASTHHHHGGHEQSLRIARLLVDEFADNLTSDAFLEAQCLLVCGLSSLGDTESLRDIADGKQRLPGAARSQAVVRALACSLLDRWTEAERWLDAAELSLLEGQAPTVLAQLLKTTGALWQGRPEFFEQSLREHKSWPHRTVTRYRVEQVNTHLTGLLLNGELARAESLLIDEDLSWANMRPGNRTIAAVLRGDFRSAIGLARQSVANRSAHTFDAATGGMHHATVSALVSQGRLVTARDSLTAARATKPVLSHLLDFAEAQVDRARGDDRQAADRLTTSLGVAHERGLVIGTDLAYAELADLCLDLNDREAAHRCLTAAERLASFLPTGRAILQAQFVRAVVSRDGNATADCLRLAHDRGQPFELALSIIRLVKHGVAEPSLLSEAYELLGDIGALLNRAQARNLMREHGLVVPGRQNTLVENEHLLAVLAAEGLSNKQIGAVLSSSERSVEGRLNRLYTRSGYSSRIQLSTAMMNGDLRF